MIYAFIIIFITYSGAYHIYDKIMDKAEIKRIQTEIRLNKIDRFLEHCKID